MESLLIFMFFASPLILVYIILKVLQKEKWRSTQKILAGLNLNDFEVFENVQIQTSSYSHFKVISGIPHKGRLLINNLRFIVLTEKVPSFLTYNSTLPLDINSNKKDVQYEMKICNWKAILLTLKSQSSGIGFLKRELLIEPKDSNDFERLKKALNNWC